MAPPTSFVTTGVFCLSHGSHPHEGGCYASYLSAIDFVDLEGYLSVSIRRHAVAEEWLFENKTPVPMTARAVLPIGQEGMLETIYSSRSSCERKDLPSIANNAAFVAGTMVKNNLQDGELTLSGSELFSGERRVFTVMSVSIATYTWLGF